MMTATTTQPQRILIHILKAVFCLLMATGALIASAQNPNGSITLGSKTISRAEAIDNVKAQTNYKVIFNAHTFDEHAKVDFGKTFLPLTELLDKVVDNSGHTYIIDNGKVIIYTVTKTETETKTVVNPIPLHIITGTVIDSKGKSLAGVSVEFLDIKDKRATTLHDGRFSIEGIPSGNHIVKLTPADSSTPQYREVEIRSGGNTRILLTLSENLSFNSSAQKKTSYIKPPQSTKSTAYFHPNTTDHTIRTFQDEAKSEYSFIPTHDIDKSYLPKAAVKTNLLLWAAITPNVAVEFGLAPKWTVDVSAAFNPFKLSKNGVNRLWFVQPEIRYWFCQRFEKHFIGLHAAGGQFNIGDIKISRTRTPDHKGLITPYGHFLFTPSK